MSASAPTTQARRIHGPGHLIQWHLYPEGGTWKISIERGKERLVFATSPSHFAARSFVVRARELLLGRGGRPIPPAVPWAQFSQSCAVSRRVDQGQVVQLTVEDRAEDASAPSPFRFQWKVEQLGFGVLAQGLATSFLQAELLALSGAEILPSGYFARREIGESRASPPDVTNH